MKLNFKLLMFVVSDAVSLGIAVIFSCYLARYSLDWFEARGLVSFGIVVLIQLVVFLKFGLYRAVLRYASVDYLVTVLKAVSVAISVFIIGFYVTQIYLPMQVFAINWFVTMFFVGGSRFIVRYYYGLSHPYQLGKRILIYGAGDMGVLALRQLKMNKLVLYSPVGFLDDDKSKRGNAIHGIKVLGDLDDLDHVIDKHNVEDVVVAIAEMNSEKLRDVVKRCREKNIPCRIIPCFSKLLEVEPSMRNIELADLMRRLPRDLDLNEIRKYLHGKCVLITGAAGSIGSELVKQCLSFQPRKIIAFDQSEYGLYSLREDLGGHDNIQYVLGDVTNHDCVEDLFKREFPHIVFHAAAYKHVPMLESNPMEAVRNNVGGTKMLAEMSDKYKVESFVLISTDKAVKPSSIMGATKRICELVIQNFNRLSKTEFVAVRFGNVLGSSGSVIPKFLEQVRKGEPVTVTHPQATRYFMLIEEAVQLVLQAAAIGKGGEIFILNMGKPVKILELAEDLIFLMGRQPHADVKIEYVGLRPGEKIHEELLNEEVEEKTRFEDITIGKTTLPDYSWFGEKLDRLLNFAPNESMGGFLKLLREIVPETRNESDLSVTAERGQHHHGLQDVFQLNDV